MLAAQPNLSPCRMEQEAALINTVKCFKYLRERDGAAAGCVRSPGLSQYKKPDEKKCEGEEKKSELNETYEKAAIGR